MRGANNRMGDITHLNFLFKKKEKKLAGPLISSGVLPEQAINIKEERMGLSKW